MRKIAVALLVLFAFAASVTASAQSRSHRVLFALTSGNESDWQLTIGNIRNLIHGLSPDSVQVEVVAFGPGLAILKKSSSVAPDIAELEKMSVQFVACENSMRHMQLTKDDLLPGVGTVPSGVVEVVRRQEQGWAYVKAGQ